MKKLVAIAVVTSVILAACKPKIDDVNISGGSADYSVFVAVGNSLTAGYADNALYISGQQNSYPKIMADQMRLVKSNNVFNLPLMGDDLGSMSAGGNKITDTKLILTNGTNCVGAVSLGPDNAPGSPGTEVTTNIYATSGPFHNIGIPGAAVSDLADADYGDITKLQTGQASPYFVRMVSAPGSTMLDDAMKLNPTFFSLWIGNNDVLGYATSGGVSPSSPTDQATFTSEYNAAVDRLVSGGAKGVLANVPPVTSIPYFTTVPWNTIALDAASAGNLNIVFGQIATFVDSVYGAGVGDQYRYNYIEGDNGFLIHVDSTASNPLGWRMITDKEFVLLTIPQDSIRCGGYGAFDSRGFDPFDPTLTPADLIARVRPLFNQHVLSSEEIAVVDAAISGFNGTIEAAATKHNLALADMNKHLTDIQNNGFTFNDVTYTTVYVNGGAFSLDGVHLTSRGYAITANFFIDAINKKYTSTLPRVDVNAYPGTNVP